MSSFGACINPLSSQMAPRPESRFHTRHSLSDPALGTVRVVAVLVSLMSIACCAVMHVRPCCPRQPGRLPPPGSPVQMPYYLVNQRPGLAYSFPFSSLRGPFGTLAHLADHGAIVLAPLWRQGFACLCRPWVVPSFPRLRCDPGDVDSGRQGASGPVAPLAYRGASC